MDAWRAVLRGQGDGLFAVRSDYGSCGVTRRDAAAVDSAPIAITIHTTFTNADGQAWCHAVFAPRSTLAAMLRVWYSTLRPPTRPYETSA